jgi:gp16 family phage-associated protein
MKKHTIIHFLLTQRIQLYTFSLPKNTTKAANRKGGHMGAKTPADARAQIVKTGRTLAAWATEHGVSRQALYDVLRGRRQGIYGEGHRAAVLLGLKDGTLDDAADTQARHRPSGQGAP